MTDKKSEFHEELQPQKIKSSFLAFYGIWTIAVLLLIFLIPTEKTRADIVMVLFFLLSSSVSCGITLMSFAKGSLRSKIYSLPMWQLGTRFLAVQTAVTLIFVFKHYPVWIGLCIDVILLALVLIGAVAADNARDVIENIDTVTEQNIGQSKLFKLDISSLAAACKDAEAKKQLEKLSEKLKYSDPVSSPALKDIEREITFEISELKSMINGGKYENASEKITKINRLVEERNNRCKTFK